MLLKEMPHLHIDTQLIVGRYFIIIFIIQLLSWDENICLEILTY